MTPAQKNLIIAYQKTFATDEGKVVLADLERIAHVNADHFQGKPIDTDMLIYDEARRSLVLGIKRRIETNLDAPEEPKTAITQEQP